MKTLDHRSAIIYEKKISNRQMAIFSKIYILKLHLYLIEKLLIFNYRMMFKQFTSCFEINLNDFL